MDPSVAPLRGCDREDVLRSPQKKVSRSGSKRVAARGRKTPQRAMSKDLRSPGSARTPRRRRPAHKPERKPALPSSARGKKTKKKQTKKQRSPSPPLKQHKSSRKKGISFTSSAKRLSVRSWSKPVDKYYTHGSPSRARPLSAKRRPTSSSSTSYKSSASSNEPTTPLSAMSARRRAPPVLAESDVDMSSFKCTTPVKDSAKHSAKKRTKHSAKKEQISSRKSSRKNSRKSSRKNSKKTTPTSSFSSNISYNENINTWTPTWSASLRGGEAPRQQLSPEKQDAKNVELSSEPSSLSPLGQLDSGRKVRRKASIYHVLKRSKKVVSGNSTGSSSKSLGRPSSMNAFLRTLGNSSFLSSPSQPEANNDDNDDNGSNNINSNYNNSDDSTPRQLLEQLRISSPPATSPPASVTHTTAPASSVTHTTPPSSSATQASVTQSGGSNGRVATPPLHTRSATTSSGNSNSKTPTSQRVRHVVLDSATDPCDIEYEAFVPMASGRAPLSFNRSTSRPHSVSRAWR